jgi:single-stranded DNA-binding protein
VHEHLSKGRRVLVVGEVENPQAYVNKAGEMAASNEITARTIRFLDSAQDHEEQFDEVETIAAPVNGSAAKGKRRVAMDIPF